MFIRFNKYQEEANDQPAGGGATQEPAKTYTQAEVEEMTRGLRESRDTLLAEKKSVSAKAKEADAARIAAEQEAAKKSGELDKFEQSIRAEAAKTVEALVAERDAWKNNSLNEAKSAIISSMAGAFIDDAVPRSAKMFLKLEADDTGKLITKFVDPTNDEVITTDIKEFLKFAAKDPELSRLMKPTTATGGGATGSKSANVNGGAGNSKNEIINRRLNGLDARLKQS